MSHQDPIVIVAAARTPMGAFMGKLATIAAPNLAATASKAALAQLAAQAPSVTEAIDVAFFGCVLPAGLGQAPARQAALAAGLPPATACTTVNKVCGSGMQAIILAHDQLVANSARVALAGGMESMSRAPYLLDKARAGLRLGHGRLSDHLFLDGLEDAYSDAQRGRLMGSFAEDCAHALAISREAQDDFARESGRRALAATASGHFAAEIAAINLGNGEVQSDDEPPQKIRPDKIASLKPAFAAHGTVTAANASSIADGAAALVLMRRSLADSMGLSPLATICGHAVYGGAPEHFPTAPVFAVRRLLDKTGWTMGDVDLFEINEAFAVVALACMRELGLSHQVVNRYGGACALGHPIGASGARIVVTLLNALRQTGSRRGIASLCIGGGEATALAIERC